MVPRVHKIIGHTSAIILLYISWEFELPVYYGRNNVENLRIALWASIIYLTLAVIHYSLRIVLPKI